MKLIDERSFRTTTVPHPFRGGKTPPKVRSEWMMDPSGEEWLCLTQLINDSAPTQLRANTDSTTTQQRLNNDQSLDQSLDQSQRSTTSSSTQRSSNQRSPIKSTIDQSINDQSTITPLNQSTINQGMIRRTSCH